MPEPIAPAPEPPEPTPRPKPRLRRALLRPLVDSLWGGPFLLIGAICAWLGAQLGVGIVLGIVFVVRAGGQVDQAALEAYMIDMSPWLIFVSTASIIAFTLLLRAMDGLPERPPLASRARTAVFVVIGVAACFGGQQAITWLQRWAGLEWTEQDLVGKALAGDHWFLFTLAVVIGAPVGEELAFRCLGYGGLRRWTRPVAALVTAFLFAVVHMNPTATFLYVWLALCCTIVYEKTGRFSAPMLVHAVNNGVAVAFTL